MKHAPDESQNHGLIHVGYGFVDKHRYISMNCLHVVPFKWGGLIILLPYEYAMLGSLQILLYSYLFQISDLKSSQHLNNEVISCFFTN